MLLEWNSFVCRGLTVHNDKRINTRILLSYIYNIYTPNLEAPKYIKQILTDIKGEIDSNTIIVGDFSTPLTSMDRSSRQKFNKATEMLNDTIEQLDLIFSGHYIQKKPKKPQTRIHILFKCTWNIL